MTPSVQKRNTGIDAVRGLAMWMVVVSHFAMWFYPLSPERYWLSLPCQMVALPVFFFISARLSLLHTSWRRSGKRALRFLTITIVGTACLALARRLSLSEIIEPENLYFWFFIALIIFETIGMLIKSACRSITNVRIRFFLAIALIIPVQFFFLTANRLGWELPLIPMFDLRNLWPCYALGLLCTEFPELSRLLQSKSIFIIAMIILIAAFMFSAATGDYPFLIGTIVAATASQRATIYLQTAKLTAITGQRALSVYTIHPFLLILLHLAASHLLESLAAHPWAVYAVCICGGGLLCVAIAIPVNSFAMWRKKLKFAAT